MSEYTPTTAHVREVFSNRPGGDYVKQRLLFNRWLWAHNATLVTEFMQQPEFQEMLSTRDVATRTAALEKLEGVQYGRQKRESGEVFALRGPPRPDWWGESQEDYEHVQRLVGRWIPATPAGQEAT